MQYPSSSGGFDLPLQRLHSGIMFVTMQIPRVSWIVGLATLGLATVGSIVVCRAAEPGDGALVSVGPKTVVEYVRSCRKANGAFGPLDQEYTDAAWNYPAVHALLLLGEPVADQGSILKHGLGYPHGHAGYAHWLLYHQAMIRKLLDADTPARGTAVELFHQGYDVNYYGNPLGTSSELLFELDGRSFDEACQRASRLGYYNLSSLYYVLAALEAGDRRVANPRPLIESIRHCQAPGGGFVDVRVENGLARDEEAHVALTFHAAAALEMLGGSVPDLAACMRFLRACQLPSGAFRYRPDDHAPGNYPDVYYTWAGVRALDLFDAKPDRVDEAIRWINELQNHDGGFGDQPGWRSRLYSTFYAIHTLTLLAGDSQRGVKPKQVARPKSETIPEGEFEIYQGLSKMPLCEAADLDRLRERKFNLLMLKSDDYSRAEVLRRAIRKDAHPMDVVLCPEAYPHRTRRHGGALLHHVANVFLDPGWDAGRRANWQAANKAGARGLAWGDYQQQVIGAAQRLGSLLYPEQDFEMEYAYSAYDDGVYGAAGYNAVLAGFNWSPRDFIRVFPWRERYVDHLTPIADADAHGDLEKWSPQLDHTRYLYIAAGPLYADFLDAAAHGRVVCVIYGAEGVDSDATYYGQRGAVDYVVRHIDTWRWWNLPGRQ